MLKQKHAFFYLAIVYSLLILIVELRFGQDYVRNYLTDIKGPVFFFGINTTLTTFLLWLTAFIYFLSSKTLKRIDAGNKRVFYYQLQTMLFAYLGCDERFLLHEKAGVFLKINDALILFFIGLVELLILIKVGKILKYEFKYLKYLFLAGIFFSLMIFVDGLLPSKLLLRLSFEDLFKFWAIGFLFMFSYQEYNSELKKLTPQ